MREIKFRLFVVKYFDIENQMMDVKSLHLGTGRAIVGCKHGNHSVPLEGNHLIQFTGLNDKNGKEIYESDVLIFDDAKWLVKWVRAGFDLVRINCQITNCHSLSIRHENGLEIIGNIYENEELLKGAK